jgi:nucleotide-binding universal stress UspA family protein
MTRPILVGYDPATSDHAPVEFAVAVAGLTGAPLIVLSVQAGAPLLPVGSGIGSAAAVLGQPDDDLVADCTQALAKLESELSAAGVSAECRKLQSTSAARALHQAADAEDAGLLVVGSSRRGPLARVVPGSTAARLLRGAPCPVAVVPRAWTAQGSIATIGVAYTDSDEAREALRGAYALARRAGATLRALTVVLPEALYARTEPHTAIRPPVDLTAVEREARVKAQASLRAVVAELGDDVTVEVDAFVGEPADILIDLSQRLDLLICGSRGYGPLRPVMLGSVTRRVVAKAHCPVVVVPHGGKAALQGLVGESSGAAAP